MTRDRIAGALLGAAVGNALAMPVEATSHDYVRMFYGGIKDYRDDERRRDLRAGQWTYLVEAQFAVAGALPPTPGMADTLRARYASITGRRVPAHESGNSSEEIPLQAAASLAARMAPVGAWWALQSGREDDLIETVRVLGSVTSTHPEALVAASGQAFAVGLALQSGPDLEGFWEQLVAFTRRAEVIYGAGTAVSERLSALADHLRDFPLDLRDRCGNVFGFADESWPFALAMFVRNPALIEATLLSAINCGGATVEHGMLIGSLLGALHGWHAFPEAWRRGLEDVARLETEAERFADQNSPTNEISGSR